MSDAPGRTPPQIPRTPGQPQVSAKLHLPLGVVCILVGDMADEHLVMVHRPAHAGARPDLALLERVLDGLRTI